MAFELPALAYATDALEPHIDKATMEIHHGKHHQAYVTNLNKALEGKPEANANLDDIIKNISKYPAAVRNNGGGHYNHSLFWTVLGPNKGGEPTGDLAKAINDTFGSFAELKTKLQDAGATRFGSGWAWLSVGADGKLFVSSTPNQDNPLMDIAEQKGTPIFGIDVWEHAYYLKYQNKRPDYLAAIWNVVNWDAVAERYKKALGK
ncbi:superoxide dismutase [Pedobacter nanyangensis]|uniref:superoxide dismutase n=1 Tax=Pedobacter nanyangensis TaxID=1562389 RepID=UPI000DE1F7B6|nr:superoxide dismutase [Pedobacter nanyangensis]